MPDNDSPRGRRGFSSQQLVGFGILALLFMTILGSATSGAGRLVGTIVLAFVCLTCFVLALRTSQREPK